MVRNGSSEEKVANHVLPMCYFLRMTQCEITNASAIPVPWQRFHVSTRRVCFNTLRPKQKFRHFADDIFKCIFLNKNVWISFMLSQIFVPRVWIDNIPASVQIMDCCRLGENRLSEPMMVILLTHICVTRPQWVYRTSTSVQENIMNEYQWIKHKMHKGKP